MAFLLGAVLRALNAFAANEPANPVAVWTTDPFEVRVAFDRKLDASVPKIAANATIEFGDKSGNDANSFPSVAARPITIIATNPPAQLRVVAARLSSDQRVLILSTDPHPLAVDYSLTLPGLRPLASKSEPSPLHLTYNLSGVAASWARDEAGKSVAWSGWLPTLDLEVCRRKLAASTNHERFFALLQQRGYLTFKTFLAPPNSPTVLKLASSVPLRIISDGRSLASVRQADGTETVELKLEPADDYQSLTVVVKTGTGQNAPILQIACAGDGLPNPESRAVRPFVPWAPPLPPPPVPRQSAPPLAGGDFQRGKDLFNGNVLKCSSCHPLRGEGGHVGPDLSALYQRDATSVLNDILDPSGRLNPSFVSFNLTLREGVDLTAFVHLQKNGMVQLMESDGKTNTIPRTEILSIRPSATSMMPSGLLGPLSQPQIRDLLTFLLAAPAK
jgi:putative heme-binding domain-containing protein